MTAQRKPHPGLLPMSLQRLKAGRRMPPVPTNEDRLLAFRNAYRALTGNGWRWSWHKY